MRNRAAKANFWLILVLSLLMGCKRGQTKVSENASDPDIRSDCSTKAAKFALPYQNAAELSRFIAEQPLKFYSEHFIFSNNNVAWHGKHIYNCFALEWAAQQVLIASKVFYETDQLVRPTLESVPAGLMDRYLRLLKTYPTLQKAFFRDYTPKETTKMASDFSKALSVFKKYNGPIVSGESFEKNFSNLASYPLYLNLKNAISREKFEPKQILLQMCQTLTFLTITHSLYAISNTKFEGAGFATPLSNPLDITLESHCRGASLLSTYSDFVPLMHSQEGVFTERGFLDRYSSLSSFLGLGFAALGFQLNFGRTAYECGNAKQIALRYV